MWPWWVMIPKEDLTDVTLVSGDTFLRLDWCDSGEWGYLLETWLVWLWQLRERIISDDDDDVKFVYWWKLSIDESFLLMKVVYWWKLSIDESCLLMKVVYWWNLSIDESYLLMKVKIALEVIAFDVSPVAMFLHTYNITVRSLLWLF